MKIYFPNKISVHWYPINPIATKVQQISFPKYKLTVLKSYISGYMDAVFFNVNYWLYAADGRLTFYLCEILFESRCLTIMFYGYLKQLNVYFRYVINITYPILWSTVNLAGNAGALYTYGKISTCSNVFIEHHEPTTKL